LFKEQILKFRVPEFCPQIPGQSTWISSFCRTRIRTKTGQKRSQTPALMCRKERSKLRRSSLETPVQSRNQAEDDVGSVSLKVGPVNSSKVVHHLLSRGYTIP